MKPVSKPVISLLFLFAIPGFVLPAGYFLWWLFTEPVSWAAVFQNKLAMAFITDVIFTSLVTAVYFANQPGAKFGWRWFMVCSYLTTLAFGFALYWLINALDIRRRKVQ